MIRPVRDVLESLVAPLHNKHSGRCFVVGTGPSLAGINGSLRERLRAETTVGINLLVRVKDWPLATYTMCREYGAAVLVENQLQELGLTASTRRWLIHPLAIDYDAVKVARTIVYGGNDNWKWAFADQQLTVAGWNMADVLWRVPAMPNASMQAIPLLWWMGFSEIYLLGNDTTRRGYVNSPRADRSFEDVDAVRQAASALREKLYDHDGTQLIDCTEGGTLPIPKCHLADVLRNQ